MPFVKKGEVYLHPVRGTYYEVTSVSLTSTNGPREGEIVVIYTPKLPSKHLTDSGCDTYNRLEGEFLERFRKVHEAPPVTFKDFCALYKINPREADTLRELANGGSNKEVARALGITEGTIKVHTSALYRKLGVRNRVEAVQKALPHVKVLP